MFNELQPASFIPDLSRGPFTADVHTLTFPAAWRDPILDLYREGRSPTAQAKIKDVPIRQLNALLRTVAPDLVTVDANASFDADRPWLYSRVDYPMDTLARLVHAWLRGMGPTPEAFQRYRETTRTLDVESLQWQSQTINLLEHDLSDGGTCLPTDRLYRLLPELLADRIAALPPYEFCGDRVAFHRVAVDARASGAQLMSWPPLQHRTKVTGKEAKARYGAHRDWYYSAVINVSLRTVPFSATPRIYLSTHIRRWVSGPTYVSGRRRVSAYLLTEQPLVTGGRGPNRFAVAQFAWNPRTRQIEWVQGGPEGLLARVGALNNLPAADVFAKESDTWIAGRNGIEGAASYHTMMGWHGVGAGLMPAERRRLTEWAGAALEPDFILAPRLERSRLKQNPATLLTPRARIPKKDATDEQVAHAHAQNQIIDLDNAFRRREFTALALGQPDLTAILLYQNPAMRDQLIAAAEASLGLAHHRDSTGPELWSWTAPDLNVRIHARELGALGAPLGSPEKAPTKGKEHIEAIGQRRTAVARRLANLANELGETTAITMLELEGREEFKQRTTDPKYAIRLGCADAGMVSQFITPIKHDPREEDDSQFRAEAAWGDGLRQLGMRLVPAHTLGENIPEDLNQLAFWIVKRQVTGETERAQFTPIAVLIRPGQKTILGRTSDMTEWVPYPQLLIGLTGQVRPDDLTTAQQQTKTMAAFVQNILYAMRGTPTLVLTHAHNTRSRWPWLKNSGLLSDRIQLGNGPTQRIKLFGAHLRFAHVATSERSETSQWWAPKDADIAGISKGLWKASSHEKNRVFYSTSSKPGTHTLSVESTKLTHRINSKGNPEIRPEKNAWNPELLQLTMVGFPDALEAECWAMYVHQQRHAEDYRDTLALPLIQHLAELTSHYGLPHDDDPGDAVVAPDTDAEDSEGPGPAKE